MSQSPQTDSVKPREPTPAQQDIPTLYKRTYNEFQGEYEVLIGDGTHTYPKGTRSDMRERVLKSSMKIIEKSDYGKARVEVRLKKEPPDSPLVTQIIENLNNAGLGTTKVLDTTLYHDPFEKYVPPAQASTAPRTKDQADEKLAAQMEAASRAALGTSGKKKTSQGNNYHSIQPKTTKPTNPRNPNNHSK